MLANIFYVYEHVWKLFLFVIKNACVFVLTATFIYTICSSMVLADLRLLAL